MWKTLQIETEIEIVDDIFIIGGEVEVSFHFNEDKELIADELVVNSVIFNMGDRKVTLRESVVWKNRLLRNLDADEIAASVADYWEYERDVDYSHDDVAYSDYVGK